MTSIREILGDSPTLDRDIAMLSLSLMYKEDRDKYLKLHPELQNDWDDVLRKYSTKEE